MSPLKEYVLHGWDDFNSAAQMSLIGLPFRSGYLFRGQSVSDWSLSPSLLRIISGLGPDAGIELEQLAAAAFGRQAHHYIDAKPDNCVDRWTDMQHYGVPTRVLDWTSSPYVAAFFAVYANLHSDGAVWAAQSTLANRHFWPDVTPGIAPQDYVGNKKGVDVDEMFRTNGPADIFFFSPSVMHERLVSQQGWFSVSRDVLADHRTPLESVPSAIGGDVFLKLIIPKSMKREFCLHLQAAGITERSLFPGIDGFGRSIGTMMRMHQPAPASSASS